MEIRIETASYNERRYGKPWIAKVDFSKSSKGEYVWGDWTGDHRNGGAGMLTITVEPGDIIAQGQKDNRQPRNSSPDFYVVMPNGTLASIGDTGAAYKYYLAHRPGSKKEDLMAEKARLISRIAEIEKEIDAL